MFRTNRVTLSKRLSAALALWVSLALPERALSQERSKALEKIQLYPRAEAPAARGLSGQGRTETPLATEEKALPPLRAYALSEAAAAPALVSAGAPTATSDLAQRLLAARSAALSPGQPIPQPAPQSRPAATPAPLSSRIGRDVTYIPRPGVGTPMQIRGERLQERVARAAPGEDIDLATARAFLRSNRAVLGLENPDNELAVRQRFADELGLQHVKFEQRWRGLSVWPDEIIVHLNGQGEVYLLDGAYVSTPRLPSLLPVLTPGEAARRARSESGEGTSATVSEPELLIYAPGTRSPRLTWRMSVTVSLTDTSDLFVDAINGAVLASIPTVMTENVAGSGRDLNGQTRPLNVWNSSGTFYLVDTSKFMFDPTSQPPQFQNTRGAIFVFDARNQPPNDNPHSIPDIYDITSTNPTFWSLPDGVSAAYGLSRTYDYYRDRHSRNSLDGKGGSIQAYVRIGQNYANAVWHRDLKLMVFGDADRYAGSLDVVAHELTHGVTSHTANLEYHDQSGAMNESFSDIFGEMVEAYVTGSNDWLIGSQLTRPIRNMSNPAQFDDPAKMSQYVTTTEDHGGVHTNSGIFNYAFYQLAAGLPGAIGLRDAERIYYRALTMHLTKNSQFVDGRLACIQSAQELFGAGSAQAQRVAQAFDAAEILGATPAPPPPTAPPVTGADSTLFLARNGANLVLSRRETALLDPAPGVYLNSRAASEQRPAVSGDGTLSFFVTSDSDACFFRTDGLGSLSCLGLPGSIASVAMSRDANVYAFVLLSGGQRQNQITVVDLRANTTQTYTLLAPTADGGSVTSVLYADTLDFTANRRYLLYDALNVLRLADGTRLGLWSISAIDFTTSQTYGWLPPIVGLDIGNPAVARTSDNFFTFEADNQSDGKAAIYAANVSTGAISPIVVNVPSGPLVPAYTGDDRGIVYSYPDTSSGNLTGRSLAIEALAADRFTPSGNPQPWLFDGAFPVIYRRGTYAGPSANCTGNATTLCVSADRFQVTATFTTAQGQQGVAQATRLTADTGYFTFFDPSNVEVVIKVLNGCGFNQKFWVFAGGLTNVATVITVTDTLTGAARTYTNPQNTAFLPIQDTSAFGTCFATSIAEAAAEGSTATDAGALARETLREVESLAHTRPAEAAEAAARPAACVPDAQRLCLSNGRFEARTAWRTPSGQTGNGYGVRLTSDTGYFWFFDPNNVEVIVKTLNACSAPFNRYWVFAAGLTNVQVTLTVTDTQTASVKTYINPLNTAFRPIQDTGAFATCP